MKTVKTVINENDLDSFLKLPKTKYNLKDIGLSESEAAQLFCPIADKAGWNIDSILSTTLQEVEDESIRYIFLRFLLSKKYDILPFDTSDAVSITFADDRCVLVDVPRTITYGYNDPIITPTSTIVLSPIGEVIVPEGHVWVSPTSEMCKGFSTFWDDKAGLLSRNGKVIFPCIMGFLENKDYNDLQLIYKNHEYHYSFEGNLQEMESWLLRSLAFDIEHGRTGVFLFEDIVISVQYYTPRPGIVYLGDRRITSHETNQIVPQSINKNKEELFGILGSMLHRFTTEELMQLAEKANLNNTKEPK